MGKCLGSVWLVARTVSVLPAWGARSGPGGGPTGAESASEITQGCDKRSARSGQLWPVEKGGQQRAT